jgi:glutamate racemase
MRRPVAAFALLAVLVTPQSPAGPAAAAPSPVVAHAMSRPDGKAAFSFDQQAYRGDLKHLPIGVFDSGIGGLTVLEAILALDAFDNDTLRPGPDGRRDFENERFVYFGDQANMPYGNYPSLGKEPYLHELIIKDVLFLLGKRYWTAGAAGPSFDKPPVKAIVIACNTATAYGLEAIREAIDRWGIPVFVVGVVEAGARGVLEDDGGTTGTVAVMATVGTCLSGAYPRAIGQALGRAGRRMPAVIQQGSVGLAGAIEGDPTFVGGPDADGYQGPSTTNESAPLPVEHVATFDFDPEGLSGDPAQPGTLRLNSVENYVRYDVGMLVERFREAGGGEPVGTVVLGCTHFPLVGRQIRDAFARLREREVAGETPYRDLIAEEVRLVDPAELTAKELFRELARAHTRLKGDERSLLERDAFFISVPNPSWPGVRLDAGGGLAKDYKYGREPGHLDVEDTINVPLEPGMLPATSINLIRESLPEVWSRLQPADSLASVEPVAEREVPVESAVELGGM